MLTYNDGLCSGGRRPRLYLLRGDTATKFTGVTIPGLVCVQTEKFQKNGKWSATDYDLLLGQGVTPLKMLSPLHGTWGESYPTWAACAQAVGLSVGATQQLVSREYPDTARRLDAVEAFALAEEAKGNTTEEVVFVFGSPTNRAIEAGYWGDCQTRNSPSGVEVTLAPSTRPGYEGAAAAWDEPTVVAPAGAVVTSAVHRPGMHDGTWRIVVQVPV